MIKIDRREVLRLGLAAAISSLGCGDGSDGLGGNKLNETTKKLYPLGTKVTEKDKADLQGLLPVPVIDPDTNFTYVSWIQNCLRKVESRYTTLSCTVGSILKENVAIDGDIPDSLIKLLNSVKASINQPITPGLYATLVDEVQPKLGNPRGVFIRKSDDQRYAFIKKGLNADLFLKVLIHECAHDEPELLQRKRHEGKHGITVLSTDQQLVEVYKQMPEIGFFLCRNHLFADQIYTSKLDLEFNTVKGDHSLGQLVSMFYVRKHNGRFDAARQEIMGQTYSELYTGVLKDIGVNDKDDLKERIAALRNEAIEAVADDLTRSATEEHGKLFLDSMKYSQNSLREQWNQKESSGEPKRTIITYKIPSEIMQKYIDLGLMDEYAMTAPFSLSERMEQLGYKKWGT